MSTTDKSLAAAFAVLEGVCKTEQTMEPRLEIELAEGRRGIQYIIRDFQSLNAMTVKSISDLADRFDRKFADASKQIEQLQIKIEQLESSNTWAMGWIAGASGLIVLLGKAFKVL